MADPHDGGAGRDGGVEEEMFTGRTGGVGGGAGEGAGRHVVGVAPRVGGGISPSGLPAESKLKSLESMEDERRLVEADQRDVSCNLEGSRGVSTLVHLFDHGMHAKCDLDESRALQLEEGKMSSSFELSRAISIVVGPGTIDRHFGTWGQIELILASIPGARIAITTSASPKLKMRDFRKIHTQKALNLNSSSLPKLTKLPKPKFTSKAAQQFLPPPKPSKNSNLSHKPKNSRPSRPNKTIHNSKPSPKVPIPKKPSPKTPIPKHNFTFPLPTQEWMAMMDRTMIQEPGQEGSSKGSGKDASRPPVKEFRSMADVLKGVQPRAANGPIILDASKVKQRGTATQEDGIPCLLIPDSDNTELAGRAWDSL